MSLNYFIKYCLFTLVSFLVTYNGYGLNKNPLNVNRVDSAIFYFEKSRTRVTIDSLTFLKAMEWLDSIPADENSINRIQKMSETFKSFQNPFYYEQIVLGINLRYEKTAQYYKSIEYCTRLINQYENARDPLGRLVFLSILQEQRIPFRLSDKLNEGFSFYTNKLKTYLQRNDSSAVSVCYYVLGGFYRTNGLYELSIYYYKKSLSYLNPEDTGNNDNLTGLYGYSNNTSVIGQLYIKTGDYNDAISYSRKAEKLVRGHLKDSFNLSYTSCNIAYAKLMLNQTEGVSDLLNYAINFSSTGRDEENKTYAHEIMGIYYLKINKTDSAEIYLNRCQDLMKKYHLPANSTAGNLIPGYYLAQIRMSQNRFKDAESLLVSEISALGNLRDEILKEYRLLIEVYLKLGDIKKTRETIESYSSLLQKLQDDERKNRKLSFETEQKITDAENVISTLTTEKKVAEINRNYLRGIAVFLLVIALVFYNRFRVIRKQKKIIELEKKRSDDLLLNILPEEVAEELKAKGSAEAKQFDHVTVMFTDFKGFTQISEKLSPAELVTEIHTCFKAFDEIIARYNIEKIKTIGDSYMCVGGLPVANKTNAVDVVNAALDIQEFMQRHFEMRKLNGNELFEMRIGINTGPVVAGIVGVKKFAYDIWGDAVNIASRMESSGVPGKINISGSTYEMVKDKFNCIHRGKISAKNKGEIDMYFVESRK